MSNALLSDVEARAERRRTRTRADMLQDLLQQAWTTAQAAADPAEARRWLERARRLAPKDGLVISALASNLLGQGLAAEAEPLFRILAEQYAMLEGWVGLGTCAHLLGATDRAREAVGAALRLGAPSEPLRALAALVSGPAGWCGMTVDGVVETGSASAVRVRLDGRVVCLVSGMLPDGWRNGAALAVEGPHGPMLGSPLPLGRFAGLEGFVEADGRGVRGWAWFPADPARDPVIAVRGRRGTRVLQPTKAAENVPGAAPLARLRQFELTETEVASLGVPLAFRGPDGRHLVGSPIDPDLAASIAPIWADRIGPAPRGLPSERPVDVLIPVYRGYAETLACIDSVLATLPRDARLIVIDDASPEPELVKALQRLERGRHLTLLRLPSNQGFPSAANAGLRAAAGRDAVLLNSDTLAPPFWLERLRAAAYSAADIGTVTPLTNDGTIVGYPDPRQPGPVPDLAATIALDAMAQKANAGRVVEIPVGVGFCLYLRRDCLDAVGLLREDLFAQGYGEENDFCLRARHLGWRNMAAPSVFVAHRGATSFGTARAHLIRRNTAILERLYPGYGALVGRHEDTDPLRPARRRIDALRWKAGRKRGGALIQVTHGGGGGVDRVVAGRAAAAARSGQRPIVLRPARLAVGPAVRVEEAGGPAFPNLVFALPTEWPDLVRLLRTDRPRSVEHHHSLGHHHTIVELGSRLRVPFVAVVHDYAWFCPRIALVSVERRYCGEPDLPGCEACVADLGSLLEDDPPVAVLLAQSARALAEADTVLAPSVDAARRIQRHFPIVRPVVEPWEDDAALPALAAIRAQPVCRIAVIGAIGVEKGFEVLLACARDARARALPLEFVVIGFTADDARLLGAGPVFVTGEYAEDEAVGLIQAQGARFALIPSVWPETWCFALTRAWQAGLAAAVFDLGAQAERVRASGRGWVLPLALSASALNDCLVRLASGALTSQSPYRLTTDSGRMDDTCQTLL